eukprot:TRINITY_DN50257_c0_g1_i1.p1 TRINITY_DN50257_c0_g1~~TRINITY_DN50257_c0_g1_i1.p1  ORF type:complete len:101 (-),score=1.75 TRINITY_DN50257_c0_g1_i1:170-472(-)
MMRSGLAMLYTQQGKWAEAGAEYEDALAVARRVRGPAHPNTLVAMYNLALHYMQIFFFKQKTAYEIGLGIPAEPLFRSRCCIRNRASGRRPARSTKMRSR